MKKFLIILAVAGAAGALLGVYLHQHKKMLPLFSNDNFENHDEHQTMYDYAGRVEII